MNAAKHICTQKHMPPSFPSSLLMFAPWPPWLCFSFFLRRRYILQSTHRPYRAGPVPAADHHRTASLVLPQVKEKQKQKQKKEKNPHPAKTRPPRPPTFLHLPSPNGPEPESEAELGVTNTSSFSHWGGALSGSTASWLPFMLSEKRTGCDSGRTQATEDRTVEILNFIWTRVRSFQDIS